MKNLLWAFASILAAVSSAEAQSLPMGSGIYKSAEDFRAQRLTLGVDCKTKKHKLRLNEFSGKPYVTVKHGGQDYRMAKDSLFGFRECNGRDYRFASDNRHYPILNPGEELLLYKVERAPVGKNPGSVQLFFSVNAAAPIQPLTLLAVKQAFPGNHRFHDLLDAQLQNGNLTAYDQMHRMTKINWLLKESQAESKAR